MEVVLTDEEFYDVVKALRFACEQLPDSLAERRGVLSAMTTLYKGAPDGECEFVLSVREKAQEA